jgi:hypothetical protein
VDTLAIRSKKPIDVDQYTAIDEYLMDMLAIKQIYKWMMHPFAF